MRIGINARFLLPGTLEGIGRYTWEITKRMIADHPEDQFYLFFDRKFDPQYTNFPNVTPIVVHPPARHPILWKIWFDFQLPKYLKKSNVDVFYSADGFLSLTTKVPTVLVIHDLAYVHYPEYQKKGHIHFLKKYTPKYIEKADKIVGVSNFTKTDIQKQLQTNKAIEVVYNALPEMPKENKWTKTIDKPYFLYIGAIHPRKNILNLVKAFEIYKANNNSEHQLILAGRKAWSNSELDNYVNQSKVNKDIVFAGMVTDEKKTELLCHAQGLVYVSLFEGFGIPVLEAFALGTPVITSKGTSMEEVAKDAAVLVDPMHPTDIARGMEILQDKKLTATLVQKGKERLDLFSWETSAEKTYGIILEAAKQSAKGN